MIRSNFYDDGGLETQFENYYKSVNSTQINGTAKISNTQLSDFTVELKKAGEVVGQDEEAAFLAPYVYGWIRNENLPIWYLFSSYGYEVSGGDTTYKFTSDEPKNSAVYLMGYRQIGGTSDLISQTARFRWDNGEWKPPVPDTTNSRYTLYNRLDNPEWLGMNPIPSNGGLGYCVWTQEETPTQSNYHFIERSPFAGTTITSTEDRLNALMNFFNGDGTLDFWFKGDQSWNENMVSLSIADFGTTGIASFTDNDTTYYVAITNAIWSVVPQTWYINPPLYATRYMPLCLVESEVAEASQLHTGYSPDYYDIDVLYLDTSTHQLTGSSSTYMLNGCYPGAYNCEFKDSDISVYQSKVIGNTLLTRTSASSIQLRLVLKPKSIACALGQFLKFTANASRAWVGTDGGQVLEDEVWYPIYTDNYEITGEFVRGDDPDFASKVADWQTGDLCSNELKKSDIPADGPTPPPFPPGPDDPEDPDSDPTSEADTGSIGYNSVVPAIGGLSSFMKSYVLNVPQLNTIGFDLWSKANSAQTRDLVYKNFANVRTNADHELLYAEILDYFVSLKWFPFSLRNNCEVINSGEKGIRVGTGYTQIGVNDNLDYNTYFIQNPICYLDGGEVVVPYTYESYMDMEPLTSVSIYIPYCGTQELQPSLVMGRKLKLMYCVDLNTGGCTAIVMGLGQNGDDPAHTSNFQTPICIANGIVGFEIPMTGNTQNAQTRNALECRNNYAYGVVQSVAGGLARLGGVGKMASNIKTSYDTVGGDVGPISDIPKRLNWHFNPREGQAGETKGEFLMTMLNNDYPEQWGIIKSAAGAGALSAMSMAPEIASIATSKNRESYDMPYACATSPLVVGTNSNFSQLILPQKAFVQVRRRNRVKASNYHMSNGYVEMRTHRLGDLQGFTTCINPKLDFKATTWELGEISELLSSGVYLP